VQPSVTKVGGLLEMKKIAVARGRGQRDARSALVLLRSRARREPASRRRHARRPVRRVPRHAPRRLAHCRADPLRRRRVSVPDRPGPRRRPDPSLLARYPYQAARRGPSI
jgi:hypothetical protein